MDTSVLFTNFTVTKEYTNISASTVYYSTDAYSEADNHSQPNPAPGVSSLGVGVVKTLSMGEVEFLFRDWDYNAIPHSHQIAVAIITLFLCVIGTIGNIGVILVFIR